jgi:hypothetical protein
VLAAAWGTEVASLFASLFTGGGTAAVALSTAGHAVPLDAIIVVAVVVSLNMIFLCYW